MKVVIKELLSIVTKREINSLSFATRLKEDLNLDSIHLMQLRIEIEKYYDVRIDDDTLLRFKDVEDICKEIKTLVNLKGINNGR
jgi:acyl carrier protein